MCQHPLCRGEAVVGVWLGLSETRSRGLNSGWWASHSLFLVVLSKVGTWRSWSNSTGACWTLRVVIPAHIQTCIDITIYWLWATWPLLLYWAGQEATALFSADGIIDTIAFLLCDQHVLLQRAEALSIGLGHWLLHGTNWSISELTHLLLPLRLNFERRVGLRCSLWWVHKVAGARAWVMHTHSSWHCFLSARAHTSCYDTLTLLCCDPSLVQFDDRGLVPLELVWLIGSYVSGLGLWRRQWAIWRLVKLLRSNLSHWSVSSSAICFLGQGLLSLQSLSFLIFLGCQRPCRTHPLHLITHEVLLLTTPWLQLLRLGFRRVWRLRDYLLVVLILRRSFRLWSIDERELFTAWVSCAILHRSNIWSRHHTVSSAFRCVRWWIW